MALKITDNLKQQLKSPELIPSLVAKVDGYDTVFANIEIKKFIRIGDPNLYIGDDWFIGGFRLLDDQAPYISFSQGTTTRITQKLDPSRGQGSSISQMQLAILDYNGFMTELVSPGKVLTDVIGRRVTIYLGARESSWPEDYNVIFRGVIQEIDCAQNVVYLSLSNTEEKKRISALPKITSEVAATMHYKSAQFQDILFKNKDDVANLITINYNGGGTAGSEVVSISGGGYTIDVQIQSGVSTASQIKKQIENHSSANQLVVAKITGDSSNPQVTGSTTLGTSTAITLLDATEFVLPGDTLESFIVVNNELIKYTGRSGNQLTGCTRGFNGSVPSMHDIGNSVRQVVRITDNGIDLALKLMLSKGPTYYLENAAVSSIQTFSPSVIIDNALFFKGINLQVDYGVAAGDLITVTGDVVPANNITNSIILEVGQVNDGSYVIVSSNLSDVPSSVGVAKFKSQFNKLPIGFGMTPAEVDVEQHLFVRDTYMPTFEMNPFINEMTDGKGFLDKYVYMQMTCFSVPRKGRSSIVYTTGPLPTYEVVTLDTTTVQNPEKLRVKRSSNENFFNQVQVDYDYDPISEKYLTRKNYPTEPDRTQIDVGSKPFPISAHGLTTSGGAATTTKNASDRLLRRYQKGAEYIKGIHVLFSIGYQVEIGDIVAVDYAALNLSDFSTASRAGSLKLMEVMNKTIDNKTAEVLIDVVNTTFGYGDRYGLISPSSKTGAGSTTTKVILKKSWSTKEFETESRKWRDYIDQQIIIHDENWTTTYSTTIRGFDTNDPQGMLVDILPGVPGENWIIQCPEYPNSLDQNELAFWKLRHAFFSPRVTVVAGVSNTEFTVSPSDIGKFYVDSIVKVHSYDFVTDSVERKVIQISGNNLILDGSLGFTPSAGQFVDLIGFPDKQQAYRVV